jgi:cold shock CspA family protein
VGRFDAAAGLGHVVDEADGTLYLFHCTQIADGSRHIDEETAVDFVVAAGHRGAWEAQALERRQPAGGASA